MLAVHKVVVPGVVGFDRVIEREHELVGRHRDRRQIIREVESEKKCNACHRLVEPVAAELVVPVLEALSMINTDGRLAV